MNETPTGAAGHPTGRPKSTQISLVGFLNKPVRLNSSESAPTVAPLWLAVIALFFPVLVTVVFVSWGLEAAFRGRGWLFLAVSTIPLVVALIWSKGSRIKSVKYFADFLWNVWTFTSLAYLVIKVLGGSTLEQALSYIVTTGWGAALLMGVVVTGAVRIVMPLLEAIQTHRDAKGKGP